MFVYGRPHPDGSEELPPMSIINYEDLLGRTFLLPMDQNTLDDTQVSRENQLSFQLKVDGEQLDGLITYNQLMECFEDTLDTGLTEDELYKLKSIQDHRCPYSPSDP